MGRRQRHLRAASRRWPSATSSSPRTAGRARGGGRLVLDALGRSPLFIAAALPLKIFPPLFNRYEGGEAFGTHVDNAMRIQRGSEFRVRTRPVGHAVPRRSRRLRRRRAGDRGPVRRPRGQAAGRRLLLYPVLEPAPGRAGDARARGWRASSGSSRWSATMARAPCCSSSTGASRRLAGGSRAGRPAMIRLTGVYHNLLRRWADA